MDQFLALADPTRRRIVELLAEGELSAGDLAASFRISQPAVSRHLKRLRESGLVRVRPMAQQRMYSLDAAPLQELDEWLSRTRALWAARLDDLDEEIRRARRERRPQDGKDDR